MATSLTPAETRTDRGENGNQRRSADPHRTTRPNSRPASHQTRNSAKRRERERLKTIAFDSAGPRKYAIQVQKAGNGNPCLQIIEGIPQEDGSFRRIYLTIWSEDFEAFFKSLGDVYRFIRDNNITTPKGHKTPRTMGKGRKKSGRKQTAQA